MLNTYQIHIMLIDKRIIYLNIVIQLYLGMQKIDYYC